jgi:hypothetical protein
VKSWAVLNLISNILTLLVFWAFAVKYWVVAKKLELFRAEIKFETKTKLFSFSLIGGSALIVILSLLAAIPEFMIFSMAEVPD